MRTLLALGLALPLAAAYTYFVNDTFTSGISGTNWQPNGMLSGTATDGLTSTSNG